MKLTLNQLLDGNEAAARVAYRLSDTIAIYPITPSSTMAELANKGSVGGEENLFGTVPSVFDLQSEGGAAHGMLQAGTLSTTITASQGLLPEISNMYEIAGELTPYCMHVTAGALATHAWSIFGSFRTSHEINTLELIGDEELRELIDPTEIEASRSRALTPDAPTVRGTAQNSDVFFQAREAANPFDDTPLPPTT